MFTIMEKRLLMVVLGVDERQLIDPLVMDHGVMMTWATSIEHPNATRVIFLATMIR